MQELRAALASRVQMGLHCTRVGSDFEIHRESLSQAHPNHGPFPRPSPPTPQADVPTKNYLSPKGIKLYSLKVVFPPQTHTGPGLLATDLCVSKLLV